MAYFVTGGTGFIGRNLLEWLLKRDETIYVLVRPGSSDRMAQIKERLGDHDQIVIVHGDITEPLLGIDSAQLKTLSGTIEHFFHLAAIYDMTASAEQNQANVDGARNAVETANKIAAGTFHHISSIAVAGLYKGFFREDMFDVGQKLDHPYHRTKYEAEAIVRAEVAGGWRVYRPSIVVGHSQTGEIDKIDGPYYFFKAIQKVREKLPQWLPLVGPELGDTNIVPVDYVAAAVDHIAHKPGLDGQAFHLVNPEPQHSSEVINQFAKAAHAPQLTMRIDQNLLAALPKGTLSLLMHLPQARDVRRTILADLGIPDQILKYVALTATFDARDAQQALADSDIRVPPLSSYAYRLWDYWERNLDPDLFKDRSLNAAIAGKTIVITGASSGIGRATALKIAQAGGIPVLVSRSLDKLTALKEEIEQAGGAAFAYSADLADRDSIDQLLKGLLENHEQIAMLVNNAGRSIRRSIEVTVAQERFHDYERTMQLNYFGAIRLIMGLLPHWQEQHFGHVVNVSSIGVQTNPPRFSAYVASKAALDAFTRVVASETLGQGVSFTTIHMPLVRTPMIAPTKLYDSFPAITPEEAAEMICEGLRAKPKQIGTRLGTFGEIAYALSPKAVDQILHMAYKVFPDSAAASGKKDPDEKASTEAVALAHLMKGVHW